MKVFVPFCEQDVSEAPAALSGARLVPYQLNYPVLRAQRSDAAASAPEFGEVQIIDPDDYARQRLRH